MENKLRGTNWIRTNAWKFCRLLPYRLGYSTMAVLILYKFGILSQIYRRQAVAPTPDLDVPGFSQTFAENVGFEPTMEQMFIFSQ